MKNNSRWSELGYLAIGVLLSAAPLLKSASHVRLGLDVIDVPFLAFCVVELWAGLMCLYGVESNWFLIGLLVFFALGVAINATMAMLGSRDCGCFGDVRVHPWVTSAVDLLVVIYLLIRVNPFDVIEEKKIAASRKSIFTCALMSSALIASTIWYSPASNDRNSSDFRSVDCESLMQRQFSLATEIVGGVEFLTGRWRILIVRTSCPACANLLKSVVDETNLNEGEKLAVVEVPPLGQQELMVQADRFTYLNPRKSWMVQTPMEIHVADGMVVSTICSEAFH